MYADDILIDQLAHHVLGVDLNDNECREHHPLHAGQLPPHQGHQVTELKESGNHCRHLGPIVPHPLHRGRASVTDSAYILEASTDLRWEERKDRDKGRQKNIQVTYVGPASVVYSLSACSRLEMESVAQ